MDHRTEHEKHHYQMKQELIKTMMCITQQSRRECESFLGGMSSEKMCDFLVYLRY